MIKINKIKMIAYTHNFYGIEPKQTNTCYYIKTWYKIVELIKSLKSFYSKYSPKYP